MESSRTSVLDNRSFRLAVIIVAVAAVLAVAAYLWGTQLSASTLPAPTELGSAIPAGAYVPSSAPIFRPPVSEQIPAGVYVPSSAPIFTPPVSQQIPAGVYVPSSAPIFSPPVQ
jgi:hypothetical protein